MALKFKIVPFLLLFASLSATQTTGQELKFKSLNQAGLLSGQNETSFSAQTINGFKKGKWFAGLGVGLDLYQFRTFPLFLDIRRDFSNKLNTPFIYADGGINFCSLNLSQKIQNVDQRTSPGVYYDLGLGWKLNLKNDRAFLLSAGYNFKQVKEKRKALWAVAPTEELQAENYDRYNYLYRRLVIRLGIQL